MRERNIATVSIFSGEQEDFSVTYLKSIHISEKDLRVKINALRKKRRELVQKYRDEGIDINNAHRLADEIYDPEECCGRCYDSKVELLTEKLGDVFNRSTCASYLSRYNNRNFTIEEVEKCYYIFSILLKKSNCWWETWDNGDFQAGAGYDNSVKFITPGVFKPRKNMFWRWIDYPVLNIICHDLTDEEKSEEKEKGEEKEKDRKENEFTLGELIQDKKKLRIFFDYWRTVPNHEEVRKTLLTKLPNNDIVTYIITLMFKPYPC